MNLFLLLTLLTAAPAGATGTPCEPVEGAPGDHGVYSQPALVRWARSHLGTEAARLVGTLDWDELSWSGSEGRYLAPPPSPSGWSVRLAAPEPLQLTASFHLEPGACLTLRPYGADALIGLRSERKDGADAPLLFVPSLPGRYTFRWHGPHIDGRWSPGCDGP
ncbi:hypothetical protein [Archangium lipolyticum]|uniref:hypothetical protein n=1 Tax=Archangium lipolyticum TaxID=2970465 RepID=UPI002149C002|nr:hypothetical protein [Archangium lipolyticum]